MMENMMAKFDEEQEVLAEGYVNKYSDAARATQVWTFVFAFFSFCIVEFFDRINNVLPTSCVILYC